MQMVMRRSNPVGGIILRRSSALRLLDDTAQYRLRSAFARSFGG